MTSTALKMLMIYSDKQSAEVGEEVARNLRKSLGAKFEVAQTSWNSELLKSDKLCDIAAKDALESNIVIISTSEARTLPAELSRWVQLWRDKRSQAPAALVALLNKNELVCHEEDRVRKWLRLTAQRAHMDFFCRSDAETEVVNPQSKGSETVVYTDPAGKYRFTFEVGKKR
jgi:hypothetical protein